MKLKYLLDKVKKNNLDVKIKPPISLGKIIESILDKLIAPKLIQPTFLLDYPVEMSPLAKRKRDDDRLVERFEGFVNGIEQRKRAKSEKFSICGTGLLFPKQAAEAGPHYRQFQQLRRLILCHIRKHHQRQPWNYRVVDLRSDSDQDLSSEVEVPFCLLVENCGL